ncbi:MAG TPA: MEKHLA domain-containing protein [Pseudonocardiaceae bacterium]|nr:MEKHLA domain-containing protein [Pseudonocardiaceae bacterium]
MSEPDRSTDPEFCALLLGSYHKLVGSQLEPAGLFSADAARWLYQEAPFAVLAHDTAADPVFSYANERAQRAFGYDWAEFTALPSRLSAGPQSREERKQFLSSVRRDGFASGYRGLRVRKNGERFWVRDLTLWNLVDAAGTYRGQAAVFREQ